MAAGKEIRTKITSVKNTQKITKAMEMVAASKMRRAQERMSAAKPYADKVRDVIMHVAKSKTEYHHPFLEQREIGKVGVLIISTDRGLCGGLNGNLFRQALKQFEEWEKEGKALQLSIVGNKGVNFFSRIAAWSRCFLSFFSSHCRLRASCSFSPASLGHSHLLAFC